MIQGYFWDGPNMFYERTISDRIESDLIFGWVLIINNLNRVFILF